MAFQDDKVNEIQEMRKVALPKLLPQIYQSYSWERLDKKEWNLKFYKVRQKILKASKVWVSFIQEKKELGK